MTVIQSLPSYSLGVIATGQSLVSMSAPLIFPILSSACYSVPNYPMVKCSFIEVINANLNINATTSRSIYAIKASVINIQSVSTVTIMNNAYKSTVNVTCNSFSLSLYAVFSFNYRFALSSERVYIFGNLIQANYTQQNGGITILSSANTTVNGYLGGQSIFIQASQLSVNSLSTLNVTPPSPSSSSLLSGAEPKTLPTSNGCWVEKNSSVSCPNGKYSGAFLYNNSIILSSSSSITLKSNLTAPVIVLCSQKVVVSDNVTLASNGMGCPMNAGPGAGLSSGIGFGGGANGGNGGNSFIGTPGGLAYGSYSILSSGSGGGCDSKTTSPYASSSGGGIIAVHVKSRFELYGNLFVDGSNGASGCGAGAAGTVYINAGSMYGRGVISATGGIPVGSSAGGAGGGGVVFLGNYQGKNEGINYDFYGPIDSNGGLANTGQANAGSNGIISYPLCPVGYGSVNQATSDGNFCEVCPTGYYSSSSSNDPCSLCTNAPSTGTYTKSAWTTSDCPYSCETGYVTNDCVTPFQNIINTRLGGFFGFSGMIAGGLALLIAPLLYYRMQRKYGWHDSADKLIFGVRLPRVPWVVRDANGKLKIKMVYLIKPKSVSTVSEVEIKDVESLNIADRKLRLMQKSQEQRINATTFNDIRTAYRLSDSDAPTHACRVYLLGSNHPFQSYGGPWKLPLHRPICLRPMLWRDEYKSFALELNSLATWNWYQIFLRYFLMLILPPIVPYYDVSLASICCSFC
jgi:hypothetical protein